MAAEKNLSTYNKVAQALLIPFDQSEISSRKGSEGKTFSYVPPERYRYRLLEVFTNGFQFHVNNAVPGKMGVSGLAHFIGEIPEEGVRYDIECPCFEPWTISTSGPNEGKPFSPEQSFQKLISAGLKAIAREIGLGLHLYDKGQQTVAGTTAAKPAATASAPVTAGIGDGSGIPNFDPEWTGDKKLTFGKNKGKAWNEVEDSYLQYFINNNDPEKGIRPEVLKEIARRQSVAGATGAVNAAASMSSPGQTGSAPAEEDFAF